MMAVTGYCTLIEIWRGNFAEAAQLADDTIERVLRAHLDEDSSIDELTRGLHKVLDDVRAAVEDWPKLKAAAVEVADELQSSPPKGLEDQTAAATTTHEAVQQLLAAAGLLPRKQELQRFR